jgi:beta-mannanase
MYSCGSGSDDPEPTPTPPVVTTPTEEEPSTPTVQKGEIATKPLTSNAAAIKLYSYLYKQYGEKIISSVMAEWNWNHNIADKIHIATGKYPAMNCYDFIHIFVPAGNGWIDYNNITPVTEWADANGIVSLMWHFNVPKSEKETITSAGGGVTFSPSETTFKASNALKEGTWENKWFYQEMEKVANVILKLQNKGIAAVWRPFHEAAGNATAKQQANWTKAWFWWGYEGADTYKKLWKAMYDYFKEKGVTNLIWVWTTQNFNGNSSQYNQDTDWYPGDNYVDIVARDLYGYSAAQNQQEFTEIQKAYPKKMVVLGECGTDTSSKTAFANIGDAWSAGAKWGWFMAWCGDNLPSNAWWKSTLTDPNVITRDLVQ